jgi:hypothetical protein
MADRTGVPGVAAGAARIPWTDEESAACRDLTTHFAGCTICRGGTAVCDTGTGLLAAQKAATTAARATALREQTDAPEPGERHSWCSWCGSYTWRGRVIDWHDEGSGPRGRAYSACPPCRTRYRLVPLADRPLSEVTR